MDPEVRQKNKVKVLKNKRKNCTKPHPNLKNSGAELKGIQQEPVEPKTGQIIANQRYKTREIKKKPSQKTQI